MGKFFVESRLTKKGRLAAPPIFPEWDLPELLQDDFHTAVLRFTHTIGRRHQVVFFAEATGQDFIPRHTATHELSSNGISATDRKLHVVVSRAGTVREAIHFNAGHTSATGIFWQGDG